MKRQSQGRGPDGFRGPSPHGEGGLKPGWAFGRYCRPPSLPTRGGWIETRYPTTTRKRCWCPSPHGEGGLKLCFRRGAHRVAGPSPHGEGGLKPKNYMWYAGDGCPSPHGEGGLKPLFPRACHTILCPSPHGEGGLKQFGYGEFAFLKSSLPTRGGWIETSRVAPMGLPCPCPSPHGEGGLKHC